MGWDNHTMYGKSLTSDMVIIPAFTLLEMLANDVPWLHFLLDSSPMYWGYMGWWGILWLLSAHCSLFSSLALQRCPLHIYNQEQSIKSAHMLIIYFIILVWHVLFYIGTFGQSYYTCPSPTPIPINSSKCGSFSDLLLHDPFENTRSPKSESLFHEPLNLHVYITFDIWSLCYACRMDITCISLLYREASSQAYMVQCLAKAILVDSSIGSSETVTVGCWCVIGNLVHEELSELLLGMRNSTFLGWCGWIRRGRGGVGRWRRVPWGSWKNLWFQPQVRHDLAYAFFNLRI